MKGHVRHQLFLPQALSDRFRAMTAAPGVSRSDLLAQAVTAMLDRKALTEIDDRYGRRLDRVLVLLERLLRDSHIELETLALFIRYELATRPPLAENDSAGRVAANLRFEAFLNQVARRVGSGQRTLDRDSEPVARERTGQ